MKKHQLTYSHVEIGGFHKEAKRPRTFGQTPEDDHMEVEAKTPLTADDTTWKQDSILMEMVAAGNYNQDEIVQFCLDCGIPLSRMFELDLMRMNRHGGGISG